MKKISREEFLKMSSLTIGSTFIPSSLFSKTSTNSNSSDELMLDRLIQANDESVERILEQSSSSPQWQYYRNLSGGFANLSAAYSHPKSMYYGSSKALKGMDALIDQLTELQYPNGTLDSGGNRKSPPDTAFLLEALCFAAMILKENESKEIKVVKDKLDKFLLAAGEGIRTGGVHTPNHRWEISSILAKLYKLYGDQRYIDRIDEWLAEGIYQNSDGNYPERSRNYAVVENEAFITIGEVLNRPEFFDIVSKNLTSNFYYMELNGELVCLDSRRQGQFNPISSVKTYITYRYMAIQENSAFFAAIAREIERLDEFKSNVLRTALPEFLATKILMQEMPKGNTLPASYTKHLKDSDLVRIKSGIITASIFGGNDLPLTVASGRSCNPTFFTFRKGKAILEYARLSTSFFNTGYVRSEGLKKDGNKYFLHETKEAYYYQPMPENKRDPKGDYKLTESLDGRFWSKMDFESRPKTTLSLESNMIIEDIGNAFKIDIEVNGAENVQVTLDLCFRDGGQFEGVIPGRNDTDFFLEDGMAKYSVEGDTIELGPGKFEHERVSRIDGEVYSTHFGSIKGEGQHLYITGLVPFKHTFTIQ